MISLNICQIICVKMWLPRFSRKTSVGMECQSTGRYSGQENINNSSKGSLDTEYTIIVPRLIGSIKIIILLIILYSFSARENYQAISKF